MLMIQDNKVKERMFEKRVDFRTMEKFNLSPLTSARMIFEYQTFLKNVESIVNASSHCRPPESMWDIETNAMLHVGKPKSVDANDFVDLNALIPFRYRCDFLSHVLERGDTVEYKYDLPSDHMVSCAHLGTHSRKTHIANNSLH